MGKFIWHEWARLVAMASGLYTAWAGAWGIFYRKFLWDFVGGKLGPVGIIPPISARPFTAIIVDFPLVQAVCIVLGLATLAIEWPLMPKSFARRNIPFKMVLYLFTAFCSALVYQTFDAAVFYFVAVLAYGRALAGGEVITVATGEEGQGDAAKGPAAV